MGICLFFAIDEIPPYFPDPPSVQTDNPGEDHARASRREVMEDHGPGDLEGGDSRETGRPNPEFKTGAQPPPRLPASVGSIPSFGFPPLHSCRQGEHLPLGLEPRLERGIGQILHGNVPRLRKRRRDARALADQHPGGLDPQR